MDTDKLIEDLVKEGKPVKRLRSPRFRFTCWLLTSIAYVAIGLYVLDLRCDCKEVITSPSFIWQTVLLVALGALAGYLAFSFSVPGRNPRPFIRWTVALLATACLVTIISLSCLTPNCTAGTGMACSLEVTAFGVIPAIFLVIMLTRAAPMKCVVCGILVGITAVALGATALQFVCGNSDPLHLLLWHYTPGFLFVFIGIVISNRFFKL